jgi:hypothetical protein
LIVIREVIAVYSDQGATMHRPTLWVIVSHLTNSGESYSVGVKVTEGS